ncbi:hypothetical protein XELAEV_18037552mg [Xenopus laevis]|uniref:Uncharacterized protein n=1 Tax=Xenopus laevis TaxID=8355 RepID=A0A974CCB7_XENLA|nr:hypothetical protein XELAEV_18037552mg [Xenopus laevis]
MHLGNETTVTEFILVGFSVMPGLGYLFFSVFLIIYVITILGNASIIFAYSLYYCTDNLNNICFTYNSDMTTMDFLDMQFKIQNQQIHTDVYRNMEAKEIEKIIYKHWSILFMDPILSTMDLQKPQLVYRRNYNLGDKLSPSMLPDTNKQTRIDWMTAIGTFNCGANICKCCGFIKKSDQFQSTNTQTIYKNKRKTTRRLKDRVLEHLAFINREHVIENHNAKEQYVTFQVKEIVKLGKRKGDIDNILTKREFNWILTLDTAKPRGLNRECDIKHYIK